MPFPCVNNHLKLILGTEDNAAIMILWIASLVQYPGRLIHWAPLIQGIQGLGKSFIGRLIAAVIGGKNVGKVSPASVSSGFNGYATGVSVNVLEEISIKGHNVV
jgi:hypothetical protein